MSPTSFSLYRQVLGPAFERLPPALRAAHEGPLPRRMEGVGTVERGRSLTARLIGWAFGLPPQGWDVPVSVTFDPTSDGEGEIWRRRFGSATLTSVQTLGKGPWAGMVRERFGAVFVGLLCQVRKGRLELVVAHWSFLGAPMPHWLLPRGHIYERVEAGRFSFHVEVGHPLTGLIVRYRGNLDPAPATSEAAQNERATKRDRIGDGA